jgi:hypothetical protein
MSNPERSLASGKGVCSVCKQPLVTLYLTSGFAVVCVDRPVSVVTSRGTLVVGRLPHSEQCLRPLREGPEDAEAQLDALRKGRRRKPGGEGPTT